MDRVETQLTTGRLIRKPDFTEVELDFTIVSADDQRLIGKVIRTNIKPESIEFPEGYTA
jgi:hypothetical protein